MDFQSEPMPGGMNELFLKPVRFKNLTSRPVYVPRLDSRAYGRDCRELCF